MVQDPDFDCDLMSQWSLCHSRKVQSVQRQAIQVHFVLASVTAVYDTEWMLRSGKSACQHAFRVVHSVSISLHKRT